MGCSENQNNSFVSTRFLGENSLKEFECVEVKRHKDVGKTIEEWQKNGWLLYTYACTQYGIGGDVHHHLLFEKVE
jgi:hypothetical protein